MEHKLEWGKWAIEHGFRALEALMSESAGTYSVGDEITLADICLVPQVYNANRFKVDMEQYPTISRVYAALIEHPAFIAAEPERQPDCPEESRKA
eukprot:UC1_evm2s1756